MLHENRTYTDKTSLLIENQFPAYIRDNPDYVNFVQFVKKYYEWAELNHQHGEKNYNFVNVSHNLLNYADIDRTLDEFLDYYMADYMPGFPTDTVADKRKLIKMARAFYQDRGIPDTYKFLFKALYNETIELFNHYVMVFKPSNNTWVQSKVVNIESDSDWTDYELEGKNIYGDSSGGYAVIYTVERTSKNHYQITITNNKREFRGGETVYVVDEYYKRILDVDGRIISSVDKLTIEDGGTNYKEGDPVIIYGGYDIWDKHESAKAHINKVSSASIDGVYIEKPGNGFISSSEDVFDKPLTYNVNVSTEITVTDSAGSGAELSVAQFDNSLNSATKRVVDNMFIDSIKNYMDVPLTQDFYLTFKGDIGTSQDPTNYVICDTLNTLGFYTYGINAINVDSPGSKYTSDTIIDADTKLSYRIGESEPVNISVSEMGILGNYQVIDSGKGFTIGEILVVEGGSGAGAYLKVTKLNNINGIAQNGLEWYSNTTEFGYYPKGGYGYKKGDLSKLTIYSIGKKDTNVDPNKSLKDIDDVAHRKTCVINVTSILGDSESFVPSSSDYGKIESISITNYGNGFTSIPKVSLNVIDIVVEEPADNPFSCVGGSIVYQSMYDNSSEYSENAPESMRFVGTFDSYVDEELPEDVRTKYRVLRCYEYTGGLHTFSDVVIDGDSSNGDNVTGRIRWWNGFETDSSTDESYTKVIDYNENGFINGIKKYGNGLAKVTATITPGISKNYGFFKNSYSFPSTPSQLIQSEIYNDYTYSLVSGVPYNNYNIPVKTLVHPSGTHLYSNLLVKCEEDIEVGYDRFVKYEQIANSMLKREDGTLYLYIYGKIELNSGALITIYKNNKLLYTVSPDDIVNEKETYVVPGDFSTLPSGDATLSGSVLKVNETKIRLDESIAERILNVLYVEVDDGLTNINNRMYIRSIPEVYSVKTGVKPNEISDIVIVGDKIEYCGNSYTVDEINDEEKYIIVERNNVISATAKAYIDDGKVVSIDVISGGADFIEPPKVTIDSPISKRAVVPLIQNGSQLVVDNTEGHVIEGIGYIDSVYEYTYYDENLGINVTKEIRKSPVLKIAEPLVRPAVFEAVLNDVGGILSFKCIDRGSGYLDASKVTVTIEHPVDERRITRPGLIESEYTKYIRGATAVVSQADIVFDNTSGSTSNGGIIALTITDSGIGYTKPPKVTVSPPEIILPSAEILSVINEGGVQKMDVSIDPDVIHTPYSMKQFENGNIITIDNFETRQATAIAKIGTNSTSDTYGQVISIEITDQGSGYSIPPHVSISNDVRSSGYDAIAKCHLQYDSSGVPTGAIESVELISGGTDYVYEPQIFVQNMTNNTILGFNVFAGDIDYEDDIKDYVDLQTSLSDDDNVNIIGDTDNEDYKIKKFSYSGTGAENNENMPIIKAIIDKDINSPTFRQVIKFDVVYGGDGFYTEPEIIISRVDKSILTTFPVKCIYGLIDNVFTKLGSIMINKNDSHRFFVYFDRYENGNIKKPFSLDEFINDYGIYDKILYNDNIYNINEIKDIIVQKTKDNGELYYEFQGYEIIVEEYIIQSNEIVYDSNNYSVVNIQRIRDEDYVNLVYELDSDIEVRIENQMA